ncbi:hypothetical protein CE91St62_24250 [Lachnospiraceae bacterium]|uniref:single-stranded DNA-binding protein n=1 Tax=Extibacter sp. GGCC_0201 TaxID=2731209 RepID=UPI001AA13485|nr:single-stranded DNA-binding protein [Extibacter sp. GGCC_0201]MBO1721293.1 single-stranded DNA-binding protein [Extibacter sp. GGCC_0201]BDF34360.1 hypothetical protein CE91St61_24350 [Lachnospiraceae bacterium]BDF38364.1 hypothetical protein CE91St62_24250 [Lachnospiraceae bacterium]
MSINRVIVSGNLTRDPEVRTTASGNPVMGFGIAVNDRRKNSQTGEWEDYPNFIDCTMFGARAQSVSRFLSKGSKVAIEGKLRWSQWETNEGQKRSKIEIIVDEIEFMSSISNGAQVPATASASAVDPMTSTLYDDDIAF